MAQACSGPAPPKATSAKPRGSTPRSTETRRTACTMAASTTVITPSASTPARSSAVVGRVAVEAVRARGRRRRRDATDDQVGVGDGRLRAAPAVTGGTGLGARAARSDRERASGVDAGDGAAAGADGVHVERRAAGPAGRPTVRWAAGSGRPSRTRQTSVLVPPMSKVTASGKPAATAAAAPASTPAAGPDSSRAAGRSAAVGQRDQAAGRRHHQHLGREVAPGAAGRPGRRAQVGVDDGRRRALVLAELRRDLVRTRHVHVGAERVGDRPLARGIEVGVQQADGDGVDAVGHRLRPHGDAAVPRHEGLGPVGERVVQRRAVLAADLDDVLEARRR